MKTLTEIQKEIWEERKKYFENIDFYAEKIKGLAEEILGKEVKVLLFGSIVKGDWGPNSDIDVLIISDNLSKNWEENQWIKTKIKSSINPFSPFQIHLATFELFERWYKHFFKKKEEYQKVKG